MSQPDPPSRDPVAVAQALTGAVEGLAGKVRALTSDVVPALDAYGKRNRMLIRRGYFFLVLDVILTVAFSASLAFGIRADHRAAAASASAAAARSSELALCHAGNTARAQQVTLWAHLLSLPPAAGQPPRSKAQQAEVDAFGAYVRSIFKPRDCAHLGKPKP